MYILIYCMYILFKEDAQDLDAYTLAKSYFDLKEYDRAAYFLRGCKSQKAYFLYMYSRYLVREQFLWVLLNKSLLIIHVFGFKSFVWYFL